MQNGYAGCFVIVTLILILTASLAIFTTALQGLPSGHSAFSWVSKPLDDLIPVRPRPAEINLDEMTWPSLGPCSEAITFVGDGFEFCYPLDMTISHRPPEAVIWSAEYNPGEVRDYQMLLRSQVVPYPQPTVGNELFASTEYAVDVLSIEEESPMILGSEKARNFVINCGVHCSWHVIHFKRGMSYYELGHNVAGGGLESRFQQIVASLRFTSE